MKPAPSMNNTPSHMNPEASDIWEHVVKRYADEVYEPKTLREQWEKAKSHFHRLCEMKGVEPYKRYHQAAARLERLARRL